jgi:hypothetical protein
MVDVVADVLVTAFEGGSNYWAERVDVVDWPDGAEFASDVVARGGTVRVIDDAGEGHALTRAAMVRGMRLEAERRGMSLHRWAMTYPDASGADNALQFALFGELVYG